jgi:hypothetical protein
VDGWVQVVAVAPRGDVEAGHERARGFSGIAPSIVVPVTEETDAFIDLAVTVVVDSVAELRGTGMD